jgi:type VI secretion system protein
MAGRGLLSRIMGPGPRDEVESIVEHVRALLNTRVGDAVCAPALGVPNFADIVHTFPEARQYLARAIRETILEHEPRLREVIVRPVSSVDPLVLHFEIFAQRAGRGAEPVLMSTTVRPGGRIDVDGR